jgi:hypothetical protein
VSILTAEQIPLNNFHTNLLVFYFFRRHKTGDREAHAIGKGTERNREKPERALEKKATSEH